MKFFIVLVAVLALSAPAWGETFTRCSLAREIYALDVPKSELPQWTCIAEYESSYRTHVVGPPNSDGSRDYGILQINVLYWCQPSNDQFSYNECHVNCDALLTDNISTAVRCARQIMSEQGWPAWTTWVYCNGPLPSINDCFQNAYE